MSSASIKSGKSCVKSSGIIEIHRAIFSLSLKGAFSVQNAVRFVVRIGFRRPAPLSAQRELLAGVG
jgi:hypothetical protein